jgi:hypothetical protein
MLEWLYTAWMCFSAVVLVVGVPVFLWNMRTPYQWNG